MTEEKIQAALEMESSPALDRIRDILFGMQMRDVEQSFKTLQQDFGRVQQEIDRLADQLAEQESAQSKKLQALRRQNRGADEELRSEMRQAVQKLATDKVERADLGRLFLEIGSHLTEGGSIGELLMNLAKEEPDPSSGE
jgi:hypothetical protein